jgi:hypothetical protein
LRNHKISLRALPLAMALAINDRCAGIVIPSHPGYTHTSV